MNLVHQEKEETLILRYDWRWTVETVWPSRQETTKLERTKSTTTEVKRSKRLLQKSQLQQKQIRVNTTDEFTLFEKIACPLIEANEECVFPKEKHSVFCGKQLFLVSTGEPHEQGVAMEKQSAHITRLGSQFFGLHKCYANCLHSLMVPGDVVLLTTNESSRFSSLGVILRTETLTKDEGNQIWSCVGINSKSPVFSFNSICLLSSVRRIDWPVLRVLGLLNHTPTPTSLLNSMRVTDLHRVGAAALMLRIFNELYLSEQQVDD